MKSDTTQLSILSLETAASKLQYRNVCKTREVKCEGENKELYSQDRLLGRVNKTK